MKTRTRRKTLKAAGSALLAAGLPRFSRASAPVTIGFITPLTGPLAAFGEVDNFVISALRQELLAAGITLEIRDSRSDPSNAAALASALINNSNVSLMLVSSTLDTTNPVGDQCELAGIPCISTMCPWQEWFFGRGGDPDSGFTYTYHFFWGLEDILASYTAMWGQLGNNKIVGGLFPNNGDGAAWIDPNSGFPPALASQNFQLISSGLFQDFSPDFSPYVNLFRSHNTDIVTGVLDPPDFIAFWKQAKQNGLAPKIVTMSKALLFPEVLNALGDAGHNLTTEVFWAPQYLYTSSLTKQTASQLAAAYTQATGKQWKQPLGFAHALFEVAVDVIKRAADPRDPDNVLQAILATNLNTIGGPISWGAGPVKNVCKTPCLGAQWRLTPGGPQQYELVIIENGGLKDIPLGGRLEALS